MTQKQVLTESNEHVQIFTRLKKQHEQQKASNPFGSIMTTKPTPNVTQTVIQGRNNGENEPEEYVNETKTEAIQAVPQTTDSAILAFMGASANIALTDPNQISVLDLEPEPVRYIPQIAPKLAPRLPDDDVFTPNAFKLYMKLFNEVHLIGSSTHGEDDNKMEACSTITNATHTLIARSQLYRIYEHLSTKERQQMQPLINRRNYAIKHNLPFLPSRHTVTVHEKTTRMIQTLSQLNLH